MTIINDDNYIGIDEAVAYLDVKTVTLRNWIKKYDELLAKKSESFGNLKNLN